MKHHVVYLLFDNSFTENFLKWYTIYYCFFMNYIILFYEEQREKNYFNIDQLLCLLYSIIRSTYFLFNFLRNNCFIVIIIDIDIILPSNMLHLMHELPKLIKIPKQSKDKKKNNPLTLMTLWTIIEKCKYDFPWLLKTVIYLKC